MQSRPLTGRPAARITTDRARAGGDVCLDLATRERGYGLIRSGVYDIKLSPVGSPPPPWPENEEYKPALGCWMWNPTFGEVRLETNAAIFRQAVDSLWDQCRAAPQAAEGLQPVVRFVDRVSTLVKAVNKTFFGPVIQIVGWVERDKVPGWVARTPTVLPPTAPPILPAPSAPAPATLQSRSRRRSRRARQSPGPMIRSRI